MLLCIDDADIQKIKRIYEFYPVDGVSTNPSILAKTGRNPYEVLKEIRSIIGEDAELFVQATGADAETMVKEAHRIDNMGFDGVQVAKDIHDAIVGSGYNSGLLAASFKNSQQVLELTKYGVKAVTVAPDVIEGLVKNAAIDAAIDQFTSDFQGLVGEGKTMLDC